ncbi:uncharacterized protein LOC124438356 isoform X2 [Xenia sp. Carnegie-2017]|uniref:uncharacterized protein LOC124438356 isoform X2 n=1 Tax=Xenia sp. Carnegie-2017 TaxID=2897299 RepID=UPI001F04DFDF|nr:uncharacterized protein LOC124438356 isoform X2 [Xenia sp. Carnegie-2017]
MRKLKFIEKRNLTMIAFSTRMFFMGVEYAVIFPSVWLYLKIFHVQYWYLGLVLSAYNMVGILSTAIVGRLADITRKVKWICFLWNIAEIVGNFMYSLPFWVGFPLLGRMIAGFGEGFISAMWGEMTRVTTNEQRTRFFAILKGCNLLGAAVGPAFNLVLRNIDFSIGSWFIDYRTSPELQNNYHLLHEEPPVNLESSQAKQLKKKRSKDHRKSPKTQPINQPEKRTSKKKYVRSLADSHPPQEPKKTLLSFVEDALALKTIGSDGAAKYGVENDDIGDISNVQFRKDSIASHHTSHGDEVIVESNKSTFGSLSENSLTSSDSEPEEAVEIAAKVSFKVAIYDMFSKSHVVALIYLLFFMYVLHTCLQGITPLIAENELSWSVNQVSILYTVWGMEIILVLVILWWISPKISDRVILLSAVVCGCLSTLSFIILSYSIPGSKLCLCSFLITIFLAGIGISVTVVVGRSLVSKHTEAANQGLVHAILTSFNRIAGLTGPLFGSSLYTEKIAMAWTLTFVEVVGLLFLLYVYKKLKVH